ncbi:hypothetical protein T07_6303 [Trichinella nelsoni]|uniref:Uncharacterized protein n=1 Tax=Trichinella nelsoni TaxID=6336 RepID=A0A0V0S426_9BILA|nr:hypothetical protein T07_6303 [Trichinella nelsoni]
MRAQLPFLTEVRLVFARPVSCAHRSNGYVTPMRMFRLSFTLGQHFKSANIIIILELAPSNRYTTSSKAHVFAPSNSCIAFVADSDLCVRTVFVQTAKEKKNSEATVNKWILEDREKVTVVRLSSSEAIVVVSS